MVRKGVYPYECMDSWKRFNKTKIATKKEFYSNVNAENITYEKIFREILN